MDEIINAVKRIVMQKGRATVAIDGRCASGKTTLAEKLKAELHCNVIHMDDFFLRAEQRTVERYAEPGGNVDRERMEREVLLPLSKGMAFSYRPFDCSEMALGEPLSVAQNEITVVEGTYSSHPALAGYFDLHVFLTTSYETQLARLAERDPDKLADFQEKWIPLEEKYFGTFDVQNMSDIVICT